MVCQGRMLQILLLLSIILEVFCKDEIVCYNGNCKTCYVNTKYKTKCAVWFPRYCQFFSVSGCNVHYESGKSRCEIPFCSFSAKQPGDNGTIVVDHTCQNYTTTISTKSNITLDHFDQPINFTAGEDTEHVLQKRQLALPEIEEVYMKLCPDNPKCPQNETSPAPKKCPECKICPKNPRTFFPICPYATPPCPDGINCPSCPSCPSCPTPKCPRCKCKWKKPRCGRCSYTLNRLAATKAIKCQNTTIQKCECPTPQQDSLEISIMTSKSSEIPCPVPKPCPDPKPCPVPLPCPMPKPCPVPLPCPMPKPCQDPKPCPVPLPCPMPKPCQDPKPCPAPNLPSPKPCQCSPVPPKRRYNKYKYGFGSQIIPHRITLLEEKLQDALKREFSLSRELQRVNNMLMARKQQKSQETSTNPASTLRSETTNAPNIPTIQPRRTRETGAVKFHCEDKECTEDIYTSLTPCTFTDIDDDGICICNDSCPIYKKNQGTCNTIKCVYTGTPKWHFWVYLIVSTFSGTIATFIFSKRHAIKDKCVNGFQTCREWRARRARRNQQQQGEQWPLNNAQENGNQDQPIYNGGGYSLLV